ncbi:MAG: hypothetical protein M1324_03585 [Patescibacteria group bacterium]|nr:hypothetical protein [Patescibacteria group bacterium]
MKKWWWVIVLIVVVVGALSAGGYFLYKKKQAKKSEVKVEVGKINPINPVFDMIRGKSYKITAKDGGGGSVFDEDKVGMLLEIPAGAVDKDMKITIIPIKKKDKDAVPGVAILPENIQFKKPVTLTFDYSLSKFKNEKAPENAMGKENRSSGSSHIYRYNTVSTSFMPALVNRNTETQTTLSAEVVSGGIYNYVLDDKNEVIRSDFALKSKEQTVGVVLESANTLLANNQKIEGEERDLLSNAITRVKADKSPNVLELNAVLSAEKLIKNQKSAFLIERAKADTYSGYLDTRCKDPATSADELLSVWKTAQLAGNDAAAENCRVRIQNVVAERVNKLLDQPDPTYVELLKAHQDVILVDLEDKFAAALEKKRHDKAVREAKELLKDPSVDPRIIAIALQNVQLFADDEADLQQALQDRMNKGLDTDVQRVLNDPNATKQDIERALAKNDFTGGNEETKKKLEDKLKNAKEGTDPKVDESSKEEVEEEMPAFDWAIVGTAFLQMMGVTDFSEAGLKSWADQQAEGFQEMKAYTIELCVFVEELSGQSQGCNQKASEIDNAIEQFKDGISAEAEKVGAIQALPEEEVDNSYDGNNEESISGSCISKEEADQIDPQGKLGYTICPEDSSNSDNSDSENADNSAVDNSSDSGAVDNSSDSADNNSSDSSDSSTDNQSSEEVSSEE